MKRNNKMMKGVLKSTAISLVIYILYIPQGISFPTTTKDLKIKSQPSMLQMLKFQTAIPSNTNSTRLNVSNIKPSDTQYNRMSHSDTAQLITGVPSTLQDGRLNGLNLPTVPSTFVSSTTISTAISSSLRVLATRAKLLDTNNRLNDNMLKLSTFLSGPPLTPQIKDKSSLFKKMFETPRFRATRDAFRVVSSNKMVSTGDTSSKDETATQKIPKSFSKIKNELLSMSRRLKSGDLSGPRSLVSRIPKKIRPKRKNRKRLRNRSKVLGCGNFVCLLEKFELLKTFKNGEPDGYFLETQKTELNKKTKKCKSFKCWISKFTISKKTDGYLLKLKSPKKAVNKGDEVDDTSWNFNRPLNLSDIFQSATVSPGNTKPENNKEENDKASISKT